MANPQACYDESIEDLPPDPLLDIPSLPIEVARVPLQPSVDETVGLTSYRHWSIGSLMTCRALQDGENMPPDAVCSWIDEDTTYILTKRSVPRVDRTPEGDFLVNRLPNYFGLSRGIWTLSPNVFCKAKSWTEGRTTEADILRWVNKNSPSIPTTKIIYDWVDAAWNRTILISRRVPGKTYKDAWPSLTQRQRLAVADQVAGHLKTLSEHTSDYAETVTGSGPVGAWSLRVREALPRWQPRIEPRVSREDYEAYMKRRDKRAGVESAPPGIGEPFVLQHDDCSPTNIFVTTPSEPELPVVTAIIDWERVHYLPKWYVAVIPRQCLHFVVEQEPHTVESTDWQWMLSNACVKLGFPFELEYATEARRKLFCYKYPGLAIDYIFNCSNLPSGITAQPK